ncbi:MAG: hypothetical protein A2268_08595 [Candidatus Raymondbacteria bacterium RifOxyA12_full_50_37]|uniref:HTH araC/xylS-type domain-containing protein n=1 Tax=Candidatus Raymondbacteria bacterium RIFOXYD12_FULL_49_13 TaxID=1817890 RepID=A0A1F7FIJ1_UNCRA|nr:MAG: hypothetical protein A2268_08595 [Candidatus Raymondbacteria bacterium RifOxyA12_full_50_37]OGJ92013.1 MAG: hypothetical protein A2248_15730 [Candidatus Raymondbacteria bacterium RIFOXYA2_FULL_49_16]OGJ99756.1 MAG: hypothetical protein A2350_06360 [Candidatus Raymondbacteria bacterium RifOxyB12_full_50_8]OGK06554.1 MAG: hypothetical protein A2519_15810 [Candidatus Raymondbacteria bacterium RIFOXYD12_FULL_49_13]OGK06563.1 MAG: hypothetical protein A2487_19770 [Candidatus Raymondbacteria 
MLPQSFTVITGNSVRLLAEVSQDFFPKEVRFYATYKASVDSLKFPQKANIEKYLGTVARPPYELIADLTGIPDQDECALYFILETLDSSGKVYRTVPSLKKDLVLDRHEGVSSKIFECGHTRRPMRIDGDLDDWKNADSISFLNAGNTITARVQWDDGYLYFGITVYDNTIIHPYAKSGYLTENKDLWPGMPDSGNFVPLWLSDEIEIFFDTDHSHGYFRTLKHMHFLVGAGNAYYGRKYDRKKGISEMWGKTALCSVRIWDKPSRYTVEIAFPWAELEIKPEKGLIMGFDLFNKDYMFANGPSTSKSWSGVEYTNYNNPSEWANIELTGSPVPPWFAIVLGTGMAVGLVLLGFAWKRTRQESGQNAPRNELIVKNVEEYIKANFSDPELSVSKAAGVSGVSAKYAGGLYKTYKKMSINQYLNNMRLEKAKDLLRTTDKNITEITFEVGYASPDYFTKVFKAAEGMVPSEYRLKTGKTAKSL